VHIAIDDFGTGYSSLSYLRRFPAETLKIDASFVTGLGSDPESEAIVTAIIGLAQALHLHTIAEGVETPEQLGRLRDLGCDLLQGYLLSPPKPSGWWLMGGLSRP
jgi:EAL domain-containing protein (putative c-di-GMP-specific phosphodiesterase class I)